MGGNEVMAKLPADSKEWAKEFLTLVDAVDKDNPDPKDVARLQTWLDEKPMLWRAFGDVSVFVQQKIISRLHGNKSGEMATAKGLQIMRQELGHDEAPLLERLLIDHVLTCWLRLQDVEWRYTLVIGDSHSFEQGGYWERRLSAAQRRYLRACETLARVRKVIRRTPALQVNIATQGGQQVNIARDVVGGRRE